MSKLSVFAFIGFVTLASGTTAMATCPTFHTLTNGTPADATQVMDNFNYILQCPGFSGPVGVGTSNPLALLDIAGSSASSITGDALRFTSTDGSANARNWLIANGATAYGDLSFYMSNFSGGAPGGTPVLYLQKLISSSTSEPWIGFNTTSPQALLDLVGTAAAARPADLGLRFTETSTSANARNWLIANGATAYGDLSFFVSSVSGGAPGGTAVLYLQKLITGSTGVPWVGLNTNSPQALLDLVGTAAARPTDMGIRFTETSGSTNARNWLLAEGVNTYGDLSFLVSAIQGGTPSGTTPVLYLAKNGYVGVNILGTNAATVPLARFDVRGDATSDHASSAIRLTEASGNSNSRNWAIANSVNGLNGDLSFQVSAASGGEPIGTTPVLYLTKGANVGIKTSTPAQALEVNGQIKVDSLASASGTALCINASVLSSCSSSRRYKEQIRDAAFGLKDVLAMRPVTFKWKGRNERDLGLIAEEVAKIDPLFVTRKAGKIEGVKYSQLTAVLVGAVKQLKAANDNQAREMTRLEMANNNWAGEIKRLKAANGDQVSEIAQLKAAVSALQRRAGTQAASNQEAKNS